METSPTITEISKALLKFQSKVEAIAKDGINPHFKSKFASLAAIKEEIQPVLNECELVLTQWPEDEDNLTTLLVHAPSGEFFKATVKMHIKEYTPQALGGGITYLRRYAQLAVLNLVTDDDDGNAASGPRGRQTHGVPDPLRPQPSEKTPALGAIREGLRALPAAQRERASQALFGCPMADLPTQPLARLTQGMDQLGRALKAGIKWDSPTLADDLKALHQSPVASRQPPAEDRRRMTDDQNEPKPVDTSSLATRLRVELHGLLAQIPQGDVPANALAAAGDLTATPQLLNDWLVWARERVQLKD